MKRLMRSLITMLCIVGTINLSGWIQTADAMPSEKAASDPGKELAPLPADANRDAATAYIDKLREMVASGTMTQKECEERLRVFPLRFADLLMIEAADWKSPLSNASPFNNSKWVSELSLDEIEMARAAVAKAFEKEPRVKEWIIMFGWAADIRGYFIAKSKEDVPRFDLNDLQLAVDLADPDIYAMLDKVMLLTVGPIKWIDRLRLLPDYDLQKTIMTRWRLGEIVVGENEMAIIAAQAGDPTALNYLIGMLRVAPDVKVQDVAWRDHVRQVIAYRGSDQEIIDWHRANYDELAFDVVNRRFVVPDQEIPTNLNDERNKSILQRWEKGVDALGEDALDAAVDAAQIGERSALEYLIEKSKVPVVKISLTNSNEYYINHHRNAVLRVMAVRGSNKEIIDLYNANKDRIVFDPLIRKFILLQEE